jgi:hypothetical protein
MVVVVAAAISPMMMMACPKRTLTKTLFPDYDTLVHFRRLFSCYFAIFHVMSSAARAFLPAST